MKINEVIQEGVWDNLKTAGQTIKQRAGIVGQNIKQGAGAIGQGVKQGAGAVANKVGQTYQQTRQAQQQRFGQAAAQQFPQSKKWLGKDWSPQAQLRAKNIGTFAGDVAKTLGGAGGGVGGGSMYATATSTTPKNTVAAGTEIQTKVGKFTMTDQGWIDDTNKPVTDPNTVARLNSAASQNQDGSDVDPTKPEDPTAIPTVTSPGGILGPGGKPVQYDAQGKPIIAQ